MTGQGAETGPKHKPSQTLAYGTCRHGNYDVKGESVTAFGIFFHSSRAPDPYENVLYEFSLNLSHLPISNKCSTGKLLAPESVC